MRDRKRRSIVVLVEHARDPVAWPAMRRHFLVSLAATLVLPAVFAFSATAHADGEPSPEELLKTGLEQMEAKKFGEACPAIRKSYRLDPRPKTLFHLAECADKTGRVATAVIHYEDYLETFDKLSPEGQREENEREPTAAARRELLQKLIPKVTFKLSSDAPPNTVVTRRPQDGGEPIKVAVGVVLPIDPGEHFVAAEVPGRPRWEKKFSIKPREQKEVEIDVPPASEALKPAKRPQPISPVPQELPPLDPPMPARRIAAYTIGGVGIASILAGAVSGAITWGQKAPIASNCKGKLCNKEGQAAKDTAEIAGLISTVTFSVGFACTATGVILYVTEPAPARIGGARPSVRVGVGSFGPAGGSVQMGWVW
jgi:hypothetical protein